MKDSKKMNVLHTAEVNYDGFTIKVQLGYYDHRCYERYVSSLADSGTVPWNVVPVGQSRPWVDYRRLWSASDGWELRSN